MGCSTSFATNIPVAALDRAGRCDARQHDRGRCGPRRHGGRLGHLHPAPNPLDRRDGRGRAARAASVGLLCHDPFDLPLACFGPARLCRRRFAGSTKSRRRPGGDLTTLGSLRPRIPFHCRGDHRHFAVGYIYTWESNQQVEEKIEDGKTRLSQRIGASNAELARSRRDVFIGMLFSNAVMYFIIMSTGATLHTRGQTNIETAAQAAEALRPLAGAGASVLFTAGIIGVGSLAVPVMTAGAAYDVAQAFGWRASLHARPGEAPAFYWAIAGLTG